MNDSISTNAQVVLMLTAPLLGTGSGEPVELFKPSEFLKLSRILKDCNCEPQDLLTTLAGPLKTELQPFLPRLQSLLDRHHQLERAIDIWQSESIWVTTIADSNYPDRLRSRCKELAPPVIYGCGRIEQLEDGGLAVVGSRSIDAQLLDYTQQIGALAAAASKQVVSGGARGADRAAMRGSLDAGGKAVGILADSLAKTASNHENRELIDSENLVLMSLVDPSAGFNTGHAMQRNKIIYSLADVALIINSDLETGGTWAGAIEQLKKLQFVPVYVRSEGDVGPGLAALQKKGALPWPNPTTADAFLEVLNTQSDISQSQQMSLL